MNNFNYADSSSWEDWQKEYKYGAFFIFPPINITKQVNQLRQKYDPKAASYCQAHISLSEPLSAPLTKEKLNELKKSLLSFEPFEIHYGPLRIFPPYPGIAYAISPENKLMKLRLLIHSTSLFKDASLKHKDIAPHMTIAEFITMDQTEKLMKDLNGNVPEGSFICDAVEYAVPNEKFYFERLLSLTL